MSSPGQFAYEEDCRRCPEVRPGLARPTWAQLEQWARNTWHKNPTPCHPLKATLEAEGSGAGDSGTNPETGSPSLLRGGA